MITRIIMDLLMIGIAFCWGAKSGMEYMEKHYKEDKNDTVG